jgi:hypothetical protein
MALAAKISHLVDEQHVRLEAKLKRELGEIVLGLLSDERTEDVLLNPDSVVWVKRRGEGFAPVGEMPTASVSGDVDGAVQRNRGAAVPDDGTAGTAKHVLGVGVAIRFRLAVRDLPSAPILPRDSG